eukprot:5241881-Alexandrium_andersonii.AAC.1
MLGIVAAEFLRVYAQQLPVPTMLFETSDSEQRRKLRLNVHSSWSGPQCRLADVELASCRLGGRDAN